MLLVITTSVGLIFPTYASQMMGMVLSLTIGVMTIPVMDYDLSRLMNHTRISLSIPQISATANMISTLTQVMINQWRTSVMRHITQYGTTLRTRILLSGNLRTRTRRTRTPVQSEVKYV